MSGALRALSVPGPLRAACAAVVSACVAWSGAARAAEPEPSPAAATAPAKPPAAKRTEPSAEMRFASQVWPVLKAKCLACHGDKADDLQGGLDLRSREAAERGGDRGEPALVPGKPDESLLYLAITREDPDLAMPPKENDRLTADEVEAVRAWIAAGAAWPTGERLERLAKADPWADDEGVQVATSGGLSREWTERRYAPEGLWAYAPVVKPAVPGGAAGSGAATNPVDAFLGVGLARMQLEPAPPADRRTLIRRATFDLLGLPPTPEEIDAFLADAAPDAEAFARVVERLLASPHYGERMARHWLDVVRYADSSGFANDYERGNAWRYRDYVVRAFNADKPYDRFIVEQLAGDELDPTNPELLVAVGLLRMGPWELTGMEVAKVARQRFLDDVTNAVGETFLAHSLQCARCHDHKFDPVPTRDYYSIQAAFATTQLAERPAPFLPEENTSGFEERKYLLAREARYQADLKELNEKSIAAARAWLSERGLDGAAFEQALADAGRGGASPTKRGDYDAARALMLKRKVPEAQIPPRFAGFTPADYGRERVARKGLERLRWELERYEPVALSVYDGRTPQVTAVYAPQRMPAARLTAGELEQTCILSGGDPFSPSEPVLPGVLSALAGLVPPPPASDAIEGRRLALARWIADARNPLTTRAIVNRVWLWHFGQPLAGNPNNFGSTGKRPTHPELLDWLAATFVEEGWSFKALHRRLLNSEAYRRSSRHPAPETLAERDPLGASYAVFRPRRLSAEELRDAMLRVSGELNPALGGIPVRPEMNLEAALQPRQVMGTFATAWTPNPLPSQRHRRSLYVLKLRGLRDPFFEVFNEPSPDLSCEVREASTVTPQVFSLFNGQPTYGRAVALALEALRDAGPDDKAALRTVFRRAYGREPTSAELNLALGHWRAMTARHAALDLPGAEVPREVLREAVEENTGEKFTFRERLDAYDDFVPDPGLADVDPRTRGLAEVCLAVFNSNEFVYLD